jgi:hypothetical protein
MVPCSMIIIMDRRLAAFNTPETLIYQDLSIRWNRVVGSADPTRGSRQNRTAAGTNGSGPAFSITGNRMSDGLLLPPGYAIP